MVRGTQTGDGPWYLWISRGRSVFWLPSDAGGGEEGGGEERGVVGAGWRRHVDIYCVLLFSLQTMAAGAADTSWIAALSTIMGDVGGRVSRVFSFSVLFRNNVRLRGPERTAWVTHRAVWPVGSERSPSQWLSSPGPPSWAAS